MTDKEWVKIQAKEIESLKETISAKNRRISDLEDTIQFNHTSDLNVKLAVQIALDQMRTYTDPEHHARADDTLCKLIMVLLNGDDRIVTVFRRLDKWYE